MPDKDSTTNTAPWRMNVEVPRVPPRIFTDARLCLFYRTKQGRWFELLFSANTGYLARRVTECPPDTKLHYGLRWDLVDACRGLDVLPKDEES